MQLPVADLMPMSLYDAHQAHLDALRRQRRAPSTIKVYALYVGGFVRFLADHGNLCPTLIDLNPDQLGKYQDWVAQHSQGTRGGAAAELQAVRLAKIFSRWLWRRGILEVDPLIRVEPPRVTKLHRMPFTQADCVRLIEAAMLGPHPILERALVLLSLDTGARIGEMCATDVADVDLEEGTIVFRKTKNGRPRRVFFRATNRPDGGPTVVALGHWLAIRPRYARVDVHNLFVNRAGVPLSTDAARRIYRALGESAGVPQAFPHRSRHTHATEFLTELPGAELHLRNRLGHISHDVLASYVTISDGVARDVANVASVSSKWGL